MSRVSIIAAMDERGGLGSKGRLLWRLPEDMARFKRLTMGHTIIMGRRTFESLPGGALAGRRNIVLTSRWTEGLAGATTFGSLEEALRLCGKGEAEVFIIGGAGVYAKTLPVAERLYLTRVHHVFSEADVFFPAINLNEWKEIENEPHPADTQHAFTYTFYTYIKQTPTA